MKKILFVLLFVALLVAACMPSQEQLDEIVNSVQQTALAQITVVPAATQDVNLIVQATFQSLTLTAQAAQPIPVGNTGSISGNLSYPSEGIPPFLVAAFDVNSNFYYWVLTEQNQQTYQIDNLPVGVYHVFAYILPDGSLVGAYDQFYLCGLQQGCNDFTLVDVVVQAGAVTPNINPGNWYGDSTNYPEMPAIAGSPDDVVQIPAAFGSIAGKLSYPSSFIPAQTVVAFDMNGPSYYYVTTADGQGTYQIDNLPPGNYFVVAYLLDGSLRAGYSYAVPCGLSVDCTDSSLIPVTVISGQTTNDINPQDWYALEGSFPDSPLP